MAARAARSHSIPVRKPSAPERPAQQLDRLIHDRVRLGILSALSASTSMSFTDLKSALDASDGNLSVHARKLEAAQYIWCTKSFEGCTPARVSSHAGRRALEKYLAHMEAIINAARSA